MWLVMIGCDYSGSVGAYKVFLTSRDIVGSLDHTCMQSYTTNNVQTTIKWKKENNKQKERKAISKPGLSFLDLDDS